ncbi:Exopolygalacturonase protein [Vigna angularis]|uniref:Exopolygalacturonase protein n=1 Tax=Phaseolus angularis TaxID=3914 RepID=A0A8T0JGG9_PHAAN|nr:Exopolygalacturonase protein [Vigna angularis]
MCAKYLFMLCLLAYAAEAQKVFNVKDYGAIEDGNTDNSVAFVTAWGDACKRNGETIVLVPNGTYMLKSVIFNGPCNGSITFQINGVLKAPIDPSMLADQKWINFRYVDKLTINGGGTFDGQGTATRQKCQNDSCQILFTGKSKRRREANLLVAHLLLPPVIRRSEKMGGLGEGRIGFFRRVQLSDPAHDSLVELTGLTRFDIHHSPLIKKSVCSSFRPYRVFAASSSSALNTELCISPPMAYYSSRLDFFCHLCGTTLIVPSSEYAQCPLCKTLRDIQDIRDKEISYTITAELVRIANFLGPKFPTKSCSSLADQLDSVDRLQLEIRRELGMEIIEEQKVQLSKNDHFCSSDLEVCEFSHPFSLAHFISTFLCIDGKPVELAKHLISHVGAVEAFWKMRHNVNNESQHVTWLPHPGCNAQPVLVMIPPAEQTMGREA